MVFHHLIGYTEEAMKECWRVLKPNGQMILSENVPLSDHVLPFFTEMFKLKEERVIFTADDLVKLMEKAGFRNIQKKPFFVRHASVRNRLENSGLPQITQDKIYQMHIE